MKPNFKCAKPHKTLKQLQPNCEAKMFRLLLRLMFKEFVTVGKEENKVVCNVIVFFSNYF